jgi:parallel beta helix pectate lyase-like protein
MLCLGLVLAAICAGGPNVRDSAGAGARSVVCDRVASPGGSDRARGTLKRPFATVGRLIASLRPGRTGCLRAGRYTENVVIRRGGTPQRPITLRSFPRASATVVGTIDWEPGGDRWRVTRIKIDGASSDSATMQIHSDGVRLDHNDITNENKGGSCILDGNLQDGDTTTHGTTIDHNRIHDCGPRADPYQHGVYLCCGYGTRVTNNYIWHASGYGIQLYPAADGAIVERNVIDGSVTRSGVTFSGDVIIGSCHAASNSIVRNNIIVNNRLHGINTSWDCAPGVHNTASGNCLWHNREGNLAEDLRGVVVNRNIIANPRFIDENRHNYQLRRGSRCRHKAPGGMVGP